MITDITQRKSAELRVVEKSKELANAFEFLKKEKEFSEALLNSIPGIVYVFDRDGRLIRWNKELEQVAGFSSDEVRERGALEFVSKSDKQLVAERIQDAFIVGRTTVEADLETKSGKKVPFFYTAVRIQIGQIDYCVGVGVNITERRKVEDALRLRNRAIESAANAIVIGRQEEAAIIIEYVNPAFEQMTGYRARDVCGKPWDFLFPNLPREGGDSVWKMSTQLQDLHLNIEINRKDGSLFWSDFYASPVPENASHISHFVAVLTDVTERKRYEEELEKRANFDTLTGLANRYLLKDRINQAIMHASRHHCWAAVVFVDLDNFKFINDSLGHAIGDQLLVQVAARLKKCVREQDTVARPGGDEFVLVLLEQHSEDDISILMNRVLKSIAMPFLIDSNELWLTCSIGISVYPKDGHQMDTLVKHADVAMYRAKEQGKNSFQFFAHDMNEHIHIRVSMEGQLRQALERNQLALHFQPQIDAQSLKVVGVEVLLRWTHPSLGMVPPAQFIPLAEETGLIIPLTDWVLRTACLQNKEWQQQGIPAMRIAVNLSARQFRDKDLIKKIKGIIEDTNLPARHLELEVTEGYIMDNPQDASQTLSQLKEMGINLAIDDFGTGHSSLSYLKRFPVDQLKIDQSFVHDIVHDSDDAVIVKAIISLGHSMGLKVVAEGVENQRQLNFLFESHCDQIQGNFFSSALSAERIVQFLKQHEGPSA